jgi:hypothetical protein
MDPLFMDRFLLNRLAAGHRQRGSFFVRFMIAKTATPMQRAKAA